MERDNGHEIDEQFKRLEYLNGIGGHKIDERRDWLLVVLRLNVPVNNFSVMSGRSHRFLGI